MRLRTLTFEGIGPFAQSQSIDFVAFEASGLFLLEGPTGAGKSTIIDALTFALYGDVARQGDSSKDRLRSAYSKPSQPSVVELVFEVSQGIYRIRRTPAFFRPGRAQKINSTVHLERVSEDSSGEFVTAQAMSSAVGEADREIARLVGLTKDQFLQTVVLPQGKFSEFLLAKSEDRKEILQHIFDTSIHQKVQDQLSEQARHALVSVAKARDSLTDALAALDQATLMKVEPGVAEAGLASHPPKDKVTGPDLLDEGERERAVRRVEERYQVESARIARAKEAWDTAQRALTRARNLDSHIRERETLLKAREDLASQAQAIARSTAALDAAGRAEVVRSSLDRYQSTAAEVTRATATLTSSLSDVPAVVIPDGSKLGKHEEGGVGLWAVPREKESAEELSLALASALQSATLTRNTLTDLLALEEGFEPRRAQLEVQARAVDASDTELQALREEFKALPIDLAQARQTLTSANAHSALIPSLTQEVSSIRSRLESAQHATSLAPALDTVSHALTQRTEAAAKLAERAGRAHHQWLHGTAASLAAELIEGQACPVCGSPEHPAPATDIDGDTVTLEQVEQLADEQREADRNLAQARDDERDLKARIETLRAKAGGDEEALTSQLEAASTRLEAATAGAAQVEAATERIAMLELRNTELAGVIGSLRETIAADRQALSRDRAELERDQATCRKAAQGASSLRALDEALASGIEWTDRALGALESWSTARANAADAQVRLAADLARAGFDDDAQARQALMPDADRKRIGDEVASYEGAARDIDRALGSEPLKDLKGVQRPDVDGATRASERAEEAYSDANEAKGAWGERLTSAHKARDVVEARIAELERASALAEPIRRLAALANATGPENLRQTPLSSWVLMSRFDDVLAAANPRLAAISQGRYELHRILNDDTRSRKAGLGLEIIDHDTDQSRAPRTLSGGETFYVSLALALGLADVVTAEAGGVELQTMFIDEGFGSLDATTLDSVMDQLGALRDSGRTVGVISHVDDMARRIPDQIAVRWTKRSGSTLSVRA